MDCMVLKAVFQHYFNYIAAVSTPINALLEFLSRVLHTTYPFQDNGCFPTTTKVYIKVETMDSSEKEMNPVATTILGKKLTEPGTKPPTSWSLAL